MTIQKKPELLTLFKVLPLPECPVFSWHHRIINFEKWQHLGISIGCLQSLLMSGFSSLPPTLIIPFSSRWGFRLLILLLILTFSLFFIFNCFSSLLKYFNCTIFTIHFSASWNSSTSSKLKLLMEKSNTFSVILGIICFLYSVLIFHFSISAIIRFIFNQHEHFSSMFSKRLSSRAALFVFTSFFNSGSSGHNNTATELISHDCGFHKNFGPWKYLSILTNLKIHTSGSVIWRILLWWDILPLLHIPIFLYHVHSVGNKGLERSRIISNAPLLSVQKYWSSYFSCNSFFIMFDIFNDSTAAASSSLRIDTNIFGATLTFPIIRLQCIFSFLSTTLI